MLGIALPAILFPTWLFQPEGAESPLLLDVFKVRSANEHQYDLPFWYQGHLTNINFGRLA